MSRVSFPVTRPTGRALLVGNPASRAQSLSILNGLGYACSEADDVYSAFAALCQSSVNMNAIILSLASLYKEELAAILTIKRRFPQIDVWLSQAEGRHAAMIEAIRLGADGLLADDGLHRIGMRGGGEEDSNEDSVPARGSRSNGAARRNGSSHDDDDDELDLDMPVGEPLLSADELRALLQEQPFLPPNSD